jgi:hypothetical protein
MVVEREFPEQVLAFGGQGEQHFAPVLTVPLAANVAAVREAVCQLHRAVRLDLQPLGQYTDSWLLSRGKSPYCQQELMLASLDPGLAGRLFAEAEKPPNLVTELRQRLIIREGERFHCRSHYYIVIRYITPERSGANAART